MAGSANYNAPKDIFIGASPPAFRDGTVDTGRAVKELYEATQAVIRSLYEDCGTASRINSSREQLLNKPQETIKISNGGRLYLLASEALTGGDVVNIFDSGAGIIKLRKANATNATKPCDGYVRDSVAINTVGEVFLFSGVLVTSGLTVGARYYLSTTNGLVTNVAPVAAGNIEQYLGLAVSSTELLFNVGHWIQH